MDGERYIGPWNIISVAKSRLHVLLSGHPTWFAGKFLFIIFPATNLHFYLHFCNGIFQPAMFDSRRATQAQRGCFDHISAQDPAHQIAMAGDGGLSFLRRQGGLTTM